ncbi:hypothetical protein [Streptomyces sp. NPDC016845]|uniref:hypothetical protein n=1 Tax=Streptomyces sp. NPDC016845 TaxID=3364972 RepID=UPI00379B9BD0
MSVDVQQQQPEQPQTPEQPRRSRRRLVVGLVVTALVLGVVGTGVGVTASRVATADRDPGAPRWQFPSRGHDSTDTVGHREVGASLLPYPVGYEAGPDMDEFGSDKEFSGREATALRKKSLSFLPMTQRRRMERQIDRQKITSMAMRSYASQSMADGGIVAEITLARMEGSGTARTIVRSQTAVFDAIGVFRKGPKIKGYKDARCYVMPRDAEEVLEMVYCTAYQGDVVVTFSAQGTKKVPFGSAGKALVASGEPASLMGAQLDRLGTVGEAV